MNYSPPIPTIREGFEMEEQDISQEITWSQLKNMYHDARMNFDQGRSPSMVFAFFKGFKNFDVFDPNVVSIPIPDVMYLRITDDSYYQQCTGQLGSRVEEIAFRSHSIPKKKRIIKLIFALLQEVFKL